MSKPILLFIVLLIGLTSFAQQHNRNTFHVTGKVIDKDTHQALEFATIVLTPLNGDQITGGLTDTDGNFDIEAKAGNYKISVEFISFKSYAIDQKQIDGDLNLGTIILESSSQSLDEVQLVAEKTTVEIKLDKKIYNIGKDLTTAGGTVSDALNNIPSVSVDIDGAISLRGNENVRILINGKPSAMAGFSDSNILSQLPADAIERVEVITSPSARYGAEGTAGILNIILRQKNTLGFNGSFNFTIGNPDNVGLSASLNYRTEKVNFFSNLGWRYFDAPGKSFNDTNYFEQFINGDLIVPEFERIREDNKIQRLNRNYNSNFGIEYFINEKSSVTASIFYRYGEDADLSVNDSKRFNNNDLVEETERKENQNENDNNYQISLNYINKFNDKGHQLTADFQYENDSENQNTLINENFLIYNQANTGAIPREKVFSEEDQKEYLLQSDYVLPISKDARFEAGYRGNFKNSVTNYKLEQEDLGTGSFYINDTISNIFDYTENVNAVYSQYGNKFGHLSFLLGLRLENTQLKGIIDSKLTDAELQETFGFPIETRFEKNYLGLFPTVNIIYNLKGEDSDSEENLSLGYNRRINRPRGWFINPFPSRSSRTNVFQGNPNLEPAFADAYDLGYLRKWQKLTLSTSVYYQHETNSFERVWEYTGFQTSDGIDIIRTIPINLSTNERTGTEFSIMYNPKKWLRLNSSFNLFQFKTTGQFNGIDYGTKSTSWFARMSSKITLPNKIDWQTNAFYRGPRENSQTTTKGIFSLDMAFSKELLKEKATLSLNVRDLLNTRKRNSTTTTDIFEQKSEFQWRQRQINLSFIYRFNQQKKKQQRNRNFEDDGGDMEFDG